MVFPHELKADILGADGSGHPSADLAAADTPIRPSSSSKDTVTSGERLGMRPAASTPERFKLRSDARGKSYWIDEIGTRVAPSDRANGIDGSTWQAANADLRRKWVAEHGRIWDDFQAFYKNNFPTSTEKFKERKKAASFTPSRTGTDQILKGANKCFATTSGGDVTDSSTHCGSDRGSDPGNEDDEWEYNEAHREYLGNAIESIACTYGEAWSNDKRCYSLPLALPDTHGVCL